MSKILFWSLLVVLVKSNLNANKKSASEAGLLNESSFLAPALGVTELLNVKDIILVPISWAT